MWAVGSALLSGVRDDVRDTREAIHVLRGADTDNAVADHRVEIDLREALTELTVELRATREGLVDLGGAVEALSGNVREINMALVRSIQRQEDFERWVTVRLGPSGVAPTMTLPDAWGKSESKIFDTLYTEDSPLEGWYNMFGTSK